MPAEPVPADPGRDEDLAWLDRDPATAQEREAWLDRVCEHDEPPEPEEYEDFAPLTAEELAESPPRPPRTTCWPSRRPPPAGVARASQARRGCSRASRPARRRRSARGWRWMCCPAARAWRWPPTRPLGMTTASLASPRRELIGMRVRLGPGRGPRRRPQAGRDRRAGPPQPRARRTRSSPPMSSPARWGSPAAGPMPCWAWPVTWIPVCPAPGRRCWTGRSPGTRPRSLPEPPRCSTQPRPAPPRHEVLDRAARLTPGGLRAAIARAVMKVAPEKAREAPGARRRRTPGWSGGSRTPGNAALMGCELPPDEVLAADQRITTWARELKAAGLDGDMDYLRARAYLDLLLGKDSRPSASQPARLPTPSTPGQPGPAPGGFASRVTLTAPLATLTDLADRPGELAGLGPVDPWLARDLAAAAAHNPKTTWCVTVTDEKGHAIGHGCARPEPKSRRTRAGPGPPGGTGFSFTPASRDGPSGGYGTWTLRTPGNGPALTSHPRLPEHRPLRPPVRSPGAMIPGPGSGTCPRSGTPPAPAPSAAGPPPRPTSSTTPPTKQAAGPACATPARNAATTTGSSSTPDGTSTSSPTAPSAGPPQPDAPTPPNPPATPSDPAPPPPQ